MRAWWRGGLLLSALVLVPGAGGSLGCAAAQGGQVCTDAGCGSGVFVRIPAELVPAARGELRGRACTGARCGPWQLLEAGGEAFVYFERELRLDRTYRAIVTVVNRRDEVLLRAERVVEPELLAPNGVECGPVCHVVDLLVEATDVVETTD